MQFRNCMRGLLPREGLEYSGSARRAESMAEFGRGRQPLKRHGELLRVGALDEKARFSFGDRLGNPAASSTDDGPSRRLSLKKNDSKSFEVGSIDAVGKEKDVACGVVGGKLILGHLTGEVDAIEQTLPASHVPQALLLVARAHDEITDRPAFRSELLQSLNRQIMSLSSLQASDGENQELTARRISIPNGRAVPLGMKSRRIDTGVNDGESTRRNPQGFERSERVDAVRDHGFRSSIHLGHHDSQLPRSAGRPDVFAMGPAQVSGASQKS